MIKISQLNTYISYTYNSIKSNKNKIGQIYEH